MKTESPNTANVAINTKDSNYEEKKMTSLGIDQESWRIRQIRNEMWESVLYVFAIIIIIPIGIFINNKNWLYALILIYALFSLLIYNLIRLKKEKMNIF